MTFLCIGHTCHDRLGNRNILGGTASYSSLVAKQLGLKTGILTSVSNDFAFFDFFEKNGIRVWNKQAERTTVFENIYRDGQRIQYLHERAETLFADDLPAECFEAKIVLFCPMSSSEMRMSHSEPKPVFMP